MQVTNDLYSLETERETYLPYSGTPSTILVETDVAGRLAGESVGQVLLLAVREHREALLAELAAVPVKANTRYQPNGVARARIIFRPDPSTWHELRRFARSFNVSICFVVSALLRISFEGVGTPSPLRIPPRLVRSMELWATERFSVYSGRIKRTFSFRLPPEIRELSSFQFWARDG